MLSDFSHLDLDFARTKILVCFEKKDCITVVEVLQNQANCISADSLDVCSSLVPG